MPEMTFHVRWPDGSEDACYSPSLVIHDHLASGTSYAVAEFVDRAVEALDLASGRVRSTYGFACSSAQATSDAIRRTAIRFAPDDRVEVLRLYPPLPADLPADARGRA